MLSRSVQRFRNDIDVNTIIEDLSNLVAKGDQDKR